MKTKIWTLTSLVWLLSLVILATIYTAWLIYPLEIKGLGLAQIVYLSEKTIAYNFNILMTYLTNPFVTKLSMPAFSSSASGLKHFADVKHLFHLTQVVFIVLLFPSLLFFRKFLKEKALWLYRSWFCGAALFPLGVGLLAILLGFDNFFTLFHQILFPGDSSWLFNPYTDPVINALPEVFFLHCFLIFFFFYEGMMWFFYIICRREMKRYMQMKKEEK